MAGKWQVGRGSWHTLWASEHLELNSVCAATTRPPGVHQRRSPLQDSGAHTVEVDCGGQLAPDLGKLLKAAPDEVFDEFAHRPSKAISAVGLASFRFTARCFTVTTTSPRGVRVPR